MDWTYYLRCQEEDLLHFTVKQKTPWTHYFSFFYVFWLKLSFTPTEKIKFESQIQKMTKKVNFRLITLLNSIDEKEFFPVKVIHCLQIQFFFQKFPISEN